MASGTLWLGSDHLAEQIAWIQDGGAALRAWAGELPLETAILCTILYADLFDYPLTVPEIQRYLIGQTAPAVAVERHLSDHPLLRAHLDSRSPFWFLSGRAQVVDVRRQREAYSRSLWPFARSYGRLIAALPFVRLVAISGALAMDNVSGPRDDIDLLIVARSGRVWLTRALVIAVVHLARRRGIELCPNYILAETRLQLLDRGLFTAHEMAQLVPLSGEETYRRLWESNAWVSTYLPNSAPSPLAGSRTSAVHRAARRGLEMLLGGSLGDVLERWEGRRKIARLRAEASEWGSAGAVFQPNLCKGHMDDHMAATHERYAQRVRALGLGQRSV